jgi:hypothetical protein
MAAGFSNGEIEFPDSAIRVQSMRTIKRQSDSHTGTDGTDGTDHRGRRRAVDGAAGGGT